MLAPVGPVILSPVGPVILAPVGPAPVGPVMLSPVAPVGPVMLCPVGPVGPAGPRTGGGHGQQSSAGLSSEHELESSEHELLSLEHELESSEQLHSSLFLHRPLQLPSRLDPATFHVPLVEVSISWPEAGSAQLDPPCFTMMLYFCDALMNRTVCGLFVFCDGRRMLISELCRNLNTSCK